VSKKPPIKSDLKRLDRMTDQEIDYSDIPPFDDTFFKKATMVAWPPGKRQVTVRLDADVLDWLKETGKGYQTRLNHILRTVMDQQAHHRAVQRARKRQTASRSRAAKPRSSRRPHAA
jgi:uncharacterized protein (DUF4415 family)